MVKTLYLHIGRHKTGTTNLQFFLHEKAAELAERGVLYPRTGRDLNPGARYSDRVAHHQIALMFAAPREAGAVHVAQMRNRLLQETESFDAVILSSEAFQNVQNFYDLRRLLDGFHVVVVGYLREYLSYCASAYAQEVQTSGLFSSFEVFERGFGLSMENFIKRWEGFADDTVWRLYDRDRLVDRDIVTDFLSQCGIDLPAEQKGDQNLSISGNLLGFKLLINALGLHDPAQSHALGRLAAQHKRFTGPIYISPAEQAGIRARNRCNTLLELLFGDVPLKDFSTGNKVLDRDSFAADLRPILDGFRDCPGVLDHPLFRHALETAS